MEKSLKISEKFKVIIKNKGLKQVVIARSMGMTKQGVSYVLNHRLDKDWTNKEIDYWCKVVKVDSGKIYELREKILQEKD